MHGLGAESSSYVQLSSLPPPTSTPELDGSHYHLDSHQDFDPSSLVQPSRPSHDRLPGEDMTGTASTSQTSPSLNRLDTSSNAGSSSLPPADRPNAEDEVATGTNSEDPDISDNAQLARDSGLLSFHNQEELESALLDTTNQSIEVVLEGRLYGMFSLAGNASDGFSESTPDEPKLACYRRNLFQVSGQLTVPNDLQYVLTGMGQQQQIESLELTISGVDGVDEDEVKLVNVPGKNEAASPPKNTERSCQEPLAIPVNLKSGYGREPGTIDIPFQWKRLQFRNATANNGRRKELQQTFKLFVNLIAYVASSKDAIELVRIGTHPIIVRGRSPSNFHKRKDMPIKGSGHHVRKSTAVPGGLFRSSSKQDIANSRKRTFDQLSTSGNIATVSGFANVSYPHTTPPLAARELPYGTESLPLRTGSQFPTHTYGQPYGSTADSRNSHQQHQHQQSTGFIPIWTEAEIPGMQAAARQHEIAATMGMMSPPATARSGIKHDPPPHRNVPRGTSTPQSYHDPHVPVSQQALSYSQQAPSMLTSSAPSSRQTQSYLQSNVMNGNSSESSSEGLYSYFPVTSLTQDWLQHQQSYQQQQQQQPQAYQHHQHPVAQPHHQAVQSQQGERPGLVTESYRDRECTSQRHDSHSYPSFSDQRQTEGGSKRAQDMLT